MRIYNELNQVGFVCAGDHIFGGSIVARRVLDCNAYRGFVWRVRDENGHGYRYQPKEDLCIANELCPVRARFNVETSKLRASVLNVPVSGPVLSIVIVVCSPPFTGTAWIVTDIDHPPMGYWLDCSIR